MNKPHKKLRIVGEWRTELDIARFADALIAFALRRLHKDDPAVEPDAAPTEPDQEAS